jgi:outer membrane protein TolC
MILRQLVYLEVSLSAYSIAREQVDAALAAAADANLDSEATLRALLGIVAEQYRELKGADDLRAVLQYQLDNAQGDEDYEFMRP